MNRPATAWLFGLLCLSLPALGSLAAPSSDAPLPQRVEFNRDIRPVLSDKCFACHGPDSAKRQANLRLDNAAGATAAGAIVPGKPAQSKVLARVTTAPLALRMPPAATGKTLSAREVALLRRWIEQGGRYQAHWSFIPPQRPAVPTVKNAAWLRNPIDAFILARIEAAGRRPAAETDPVTLIRRVTFDLTGLPPTPEEVEAFAADCAAEVKGQKSKVNRGEGDGPGSSSSSIRTIHHPPSTINSPYDRLVDRLLASPRFGERMAIYWLDLVRYADTVGYHGDQEHAISPYRDYVIKAFNDDMPFDRFTVEQLAGDLLPDATVNQKIATGYNRLLQTTHEGGAQDREYRAKYAADRVRNFSVVWLGGTMGCAECHDHKFDPYTQRDFYSLVAFFADIEERGAYPGPDVTPVPRAPEMEVLSPFDQAEAEQLEQQIAGLKARAAMGGGGGTAELAALQQRLAAVQQRKRKTMITVSTTPRAVRILRRGNWMDDGGEVVTPAVPAFLKPLEVKDRRPTRLDLARWLTAPDHPQTARVFANRAWSLFFGAGLCRSLEDTGSQGEWPTHPELLDYLVTEFVRGAADGSAREQGRGGEGVKSGSICPSPSLPLSPAPRPWSVKSLVRLIVTSAAYRQASAVPREALLADPENRLFARQGRFRLPAEMIRDNALAVSGLLVERLGGPSARPYQPDGYYQFLNFPKRTYQADQDQNQYRRGVYVHWQRQFLHPMLKAFDAPSREECTAQRPRTNTPLAALTLLNDPTFVEAARVLATRAAREGGATADARIRWAWRLVLSRAPIEREVATLNRLYEENRATYAGDPAAAKALLGTGMAPVPSDIDPAELAALTQVTRALLNLSETVTRS